MTADRLNMHNINISQKVKTLACNPIVLVLTGALALRIWSAATRCIINPDGAQYIYQASMIFNQQWSDLLSCKLNFISPFPFLIAAAFGLVGDWVVAGQAVNVLFGWSAMIPLYFLLLRFVDRTAAILTVLIYAAIPVFVEGSGNVLRDPLFWFLICMGMLMFTRHWDERAQKGRFRYDLMLSGLFLLLASWERIEGIVFLAATLLYLLFSRTDRKIEKSLFFLSIPIAMIIVTSGVMLVSANHFGPFLKLNQVYSKITQFSAHFEQLSTQIRQSGSQEGFLFGVFLQRVREILPFIPLVVLFHNLLEGFFYPYVLIYFIGFRGLLQNCRQDPRIVFFLWLSLASLMVLYVHLLHTWVMAYRFLAILIYPGAVITANGITTILHHLQTKRRWRAKTAVGVVAAYLIIFGVPKSLKPEEQDKVVYRQAAALLAQTSPDRPAANISAVTASRGFEWVVLYANRNNPIVPCARRLRRHIPNDYQRFVSELDKARSRYFFYEERSWPKERFDLLAAPHALDFNLLGSWQHPDSRRFMLFQRKSP